MEIEDGIDPHHEVKKLQDLVKKLELQNEALRTKHDSARQQNGDVDLLNGIKDSTNLPPEENLALQDFEDVDYTTILTQNDDSWLYFPTQTPSPHLSEESLLSWVRQDFDHPRPEVASSRRDLLNKLDEAARMRHSSSSPLLGSQPAASKSTSALSRSTEDNVPHTPNYRNGSQGRPGFVTPAQKIPSIDSGTFTRPRRPATALGAGPMHGEGDQPQQPMDGSYYLGDAADISDIENMAKLQEANLRQNLTPANRKALRTKQALFDGENEPRLSPSRFDLDGSYLTKHRGSLGSDHSTPPDSPHQVNQNFHLHNSHGKDSQVLRSENLQNLPGSLQRGPLNSSDSSLERNSVNSANSDEGSNTRYPHHQSKLAPEAHRSGHASGRSMLQAPNYRNAQQTRRAIPSGLAQPQQRGVSPTNRGSGIVPPGASQRQQQKRGLSPQRPATAGPDQQRRGVSPQRSTGLPQPRRQIMKPGSIAGRSSVPTFRRSNLPAPKSTSTGASEENWRDGCF